METLFFAVGALAGVIVGALLMDFRLVKVRARWHARYESLLKSWESERDLLQKQMERERVIAHEERRELYSRIQAYDPYVNDARPAPDFTEPSRPGEVVEGPKTYTEEDLGAMKLVAQADGTIRDTRTDAIFETVEDWRYWQADLKKRGLPEGLHPGTVREHGYEEAMQEAKRRRAEAASKH